MEPRKPEPLPPLHTASRRGGLMLATIANARTPRYPPRLVDDGRPGPEASDIPDKESSRRSAAAAKKRSLAVSDEYEQKIARRGGQKATSHRRGQTRPR